MTGKLRELSPLDLGKYGETYAKDLLSCVTEEVSRVEMQDVRWARRPDDAECALRLARVPGDATAGERECVRVSRLSPTSVTRAYAACGRVVDMVRSGAKIDVDSRTTEAEMAVGRLFGGSERVAKEFFRDGGEVRMRVRTEGDRRVQRGCSVLAGKTSPDSTYFSTEPTCTPVCIGVVSHVARRRRMSNREVALTCRLLGSYSVRSRLCF
jgi:hypothetical protein